MKRVFLLAMLVLMVGCGAGPKYGDDCQGSKGDGIIGSDDQSCMACSVGSATTAPSGNCSNEVKGVYCCVGATSGGHAGSAYCSVGYCYSYLESMCCPKSAKYACNGLCYNYSGGGGCSSYRTTCY